MAGDYEHARRLLEEYDLAHVIDELENDREIVLTYPELENLRIGGCIVRNGVSITYD